MLCSMTLCAFDLQYGSYFTVGNVRIDAGKLLLPVENKKYKNIKVLSQKLFDFLNGCEADCAYAAPDIQFESEDYRKAFSNDRMLIADVSFNREIAVTFLIFKNENGFSIKTPSDFKFTDKRLEKEVRGYLNRLAEENL